MNFGRKTQLMLARAKERAQLAVYRIQGKQVVHFLHVGKTGGTAIKYALRQNPSASGFVVLLHAHRVKLRDIPAGELFMFGVRDPISRFVSGFYSRQRQGQPRIYIPWRPDERLAFEYFATPDQLATAISSPDSEERGRAHAAMRAIQHVRSSYWEWFKDEAYFQSRLPDLFFIFFQQHLSEDFDLLKAKLGLPADAQLPTDVHAHRNPDGLNKALSAAATGNLKQWYAKDYEFLDLCREVIRQRPELKRSARANQK